MSKQLARSVASRLNLQPMMLSALHAEMLVADSIRSLMNADAQEERQAEKSRSGELLAAYGQPTNLERDKPFAFANGIAFIPVHGLLLNRFSYSWGWATGYNFIRNQHLAALADPEVENIIFDVNSDGGEVAGCFELCDDLFAARKQKPSCAIIDSNCHSAGYAIASSAGSVIITPSGSAGSIGVFSMHISIEKMLEEAGVKVTMMFSGDHKVDGNPYEDLPPKVKADVQARVGKTREKFVSVVSRNRGVDAKVIRDTEAACFDAEACVSLGLVDSIAPASAAVIEFINGHSRPNNPTDEDSTMSTSTETTAQGAGAAPAAQTASTAAPADAAQTTAAQTTDTTKDERTAERERIAAITGCEEAASRQKLASHLALKTNMTAEEAKAVLAASPSEAQQASASGFLQAMNADTHPNVGADTSASGEQVEELSPAKRILAAQALATGQKLQ